MNYLDNNKSLSELFLNNVEDRDRIKEILQYLDDEEREWFFDGIMARTEYFEEEEE